VNGEPCGAVRLYPLEPDALEWKGDRLAVLPEHRAHHLGAELVRFAVVTAGWLGGRRMIAHVQLPNVRFFEHLGWRAEGKPTEFHGALHQLMSIGLGRSEGG
jgi:GNAT superfamily N-acetyltransferase